MGNGYLTSADVAMLVHGSGVSMYPQLYYQHLENHQLLPRTHLGSFENGNGKNMTKYFDVKFGINS